MSTVATERGARITVCKKGLEVDPTAPTVVGFVVYVPEVVSQEAEHIDALLRAAVDLAPPGWKELGGCDRLAIDIQLLPEEDE